MKLLDQTYQTNQEKLKNGQPLLPDDLTLLYKLNGIYEGYSSLFRDGNFAEAWRQYTSNITHRRILAIAPSESDADQRAAELVTSVLEDQPELAQTLITSDLYGWAIGKLKWSMVNGQKIPLFIGQHQDDYIWVRNDDRTAKVPRDLSGRYELRDKQNRPLTGWDKHFVYNSSNLFFTGKTSPYGRGLGEILYWWIRELKNPAMGAWAASLDIHSLPPLKVTKEGMGYDLPPQGKAIIDAAQEVLAMRGVLDFSDLPGIDAEFLNSPGLIKPEVLIDYVDEMVRMVINGPNLSSKSGSVGTFALGKIHIGITRKIYKAAADNLSKHLSPLARWITEENVPGATPPKLMLEFPDIEDLDAEIDRWVKLDPLGIQPKDETIERTLGSGYERVERDREPTGRSPLSFSQVPLDSDVEASKKPWDIEAVERAGANPAFEATLEKIRQELEAIARENPNTPDGELFQLAQQRIDSLLGDLPTEESAKALGNLLVGANLMGRFSLTE